MHSSLGGIIGVMKKILEKGMTLIELIVSIAIFTIITSVVIFNNSEFNSNVLVTNLSYEVALAIRQAQTYGLSVKNGADYPFGVYFDLSGNPDDLTNGKSFLIFGDVNGDGVFYDQGAYSGACTGEHVVDGDSASDTCEERLSLRGNVSIEEFCINSGTGADVCRTASDGGWASILFKRPNPVANIYAGDYGDLLCNPSTCSDDLLRPYRQQSISISISSTKTPRAKTILVERTGQISVVQ